MLELRVGYPTRTEEEAIVEQTTGARAARLEPVLDATQVRAAQELVRRIPVSKQLVRAAVALTRLTRPADGDAPAMVREYVEWGAGPRASQYLVLGAKARAAIAGRPMADLDDVRAVALPVLRHRVVTNFAAEAAGRTNDDVVRELVAGSGWTGEPGDSATRRQGNEPARADARAVRVSGAGAGQVALASKVLTVSWPQLGP